VARQILVREGTRFFFVEKPGRLARSKKTRPLQNSIAWLMLRTSSRFLKKAAQKLLECWSRAFESPVAQIQESLFASFSAEKEGLALLGLSKIF
jgi:hypothetical protein